jgi:hypothetical protein
MAGKKQAGYWDCLPAIEADCRTGHAFEPPVISTVDCIVLRHRGKRIERAVSQAGLKYSAVGNFRNTRIKSSSLRGVG